MIWIIFGKLPTIIGLSVALYICAKRIAPLLAAWSFAAFFVSLSIGAAVFPSILGALAGGALSLFLVLSLLSNQEQLWRSVIWPLVTALISIIVIGRIGCWLSGCCFGEVSHLPWATQYTDELTINIYHAQRYGHLAEHGPLAVHPVQLYECLAALVLLIIFSFSKKRLGEVSSAFFLLGSYLGVYAILNPLRAYLNTPASLVNWGPLSKLQWVLLTLSVVAFMVASRCIKVSNLTLSDVKEAKRFNQSFKMESMWQQLVLWSVLVGLGSLSLYLGTPFSAQLSVVGMCLSTVALIESLEIQNKLPYIQLAIPKFYRLQESTELGSAITLRYIILLALLPLCLIPLTLRGIATPPGTGSFSSGKNWVYQMDKGSQKLVRIGRIEDFLQPLSRVEVDHDAQKPKNNDSLYDDLKGAKLSSQDPTNRRRFQTQSQRQQMSFTLGVSKLNFQDYYEITSGGGSSCSGPDSITRYNNKQTRELHQAVVSYDLPMTSLKAKHRLIGSWYHEKVNGTRSITTLDDGFREANVNVVALDQMHLGLAYEYVNDFLRVGAGLRFVWGNTNDQFSSDDFEYSPEAIKGDVLFGLGYRYVFLQGGTGPIWGTPGLANPFFGLGIYAPFHEKFKLFGRFGQASFGPGDIKIGAAELGVQVPYARLSVSFAKNYFSGVKLGYIY